MSVVHGQIESVKINPAIIVSQRFNSLSVSLNNWLGGIKGNFLSYHWHWSCKTHHIRNPKKEIHLLKSEGYNFIPLSKIVLIVV